jgi:hypothetical protein
MSQHCLSSSKFHSEESQPKHLNKPRFPAADVETADRPQYTSTEKEFQGIELRAEAFVDEGACSNVDRTIDGILGEIAVSELMPTAEKPDTDVYPHGDGGWDIRINGEKSDIKTAMETTDHPSLTVSEPLKAECYYLVNRIDKKTCRLVGYAVRETINRKSKSHDNRFDYMLTQEELRPISKDLLRSTY